MQKLIKSFSIIQFEHVPRAQNKHADALTTLASKVDIPKEVANIKVMKNTLRATSTELIPEVLIDKEDWHTLIIQKLAQPLYSVITRALKNFVLKNGELYYRGNRGVLARAISKTEAKTKLERVQDLCCGDNDISLYRRLQRRGYYWPNMKQHTADLQGKCMKCQEFLDVNESLFIEEAGDWKQPYLDFLQHKLLPSNRNDAIKVQMISTRFFVEDGLLFRKCLSQATLRCITGDEIVNFLGEVHFGDCGEHRGGSRLFIKLLS